MLKKIEIIKRLNYHSDTLYRAVTVGFFLSLFGREIKMKIEKMMEGEITVLKVAGQLTSATSPELENAINKVLETENNLVLDFAELAFLASSGIRVILSTQKKINAKEGALVIRNVNKVVMDVFEMTGLRDFLNIFQGNRQISGS